MIPRKHHHFGKILAMISLVIVIVGIGLYTSSTNNQITGHAIVKSDVMKAVKAAFPDLDKRDADDVMVTTKPGSDTVTGARITIGDTVIEYRNGVFKRDDGVGEITYKQENGDPADQYDYTRAVASEATEDPTKVAGYKATVKAGCSGIFCELDALTTPTGLGFFSKYFFEQKTLDDWRESVDRFFANYYLGTEYWESEICSLYVDRTGEGVAYFNNKVGASGIAAHVEATRSQAISTPPGFKLANETQAGSEQGIIQSGDIYLYKITFGVRNGISDRDTAGLSLMRFNVYMKGSKEVALFQKDIELTKGNSFSASGKKAIVQYSRNFYDTICIHFEQLPLQWTLYENELCNFIPEPDTTPTYASPQEQATTTTTNNENGINHI